MTSTHRLSASARGYGRGHKEERKRWEPKVDAGLVDCWRCGQPIEPGRPWDLGHDDEDRTIWRGPEHLTCNRKTGGANGGMVTAALRRRGVRQSRDW